MALKLRSSATKTASITPTQSTTLIKNLFRAAFSSVAYIRNFFDDNCFELGRLGTTRYYKISVTEKEEVQRFVDWLELGVFDALQHKYLEVVLLQVFAGQVDNAKGGKEAGKQKELLECFSFNVSYGSDGAHFQLSGMEGVHATSRPQDSKDHIKMNTSDVLRTLVELTNSLRPLPPNRILSMKLMYTENTPKEYEPPLFKKAQEDEKSWFEDKPLRVSAGVVTTPYHQLSMSIRVTSDNKNKKARVLERRVKLNTKSAKSGAKAGVNTAEETIDLDVGGSMGNTTRAQVHCGIRESQDIGNQDKDMHLSTDTPTECNDDKHRDTEQVSQHCGRKRKGDYARNESKAQTWTRSKRQRKKSVVEKEIVQSQGTAVKSPRRRKA